MGVRGRRASGQGLASESPAPAAATSSAVGSRRFLLCLYLVGFLVSARPGARESRGVQGLGSRQGCADPSSRGLTQTLKCAVRCLLSPFTPDLRCGSGRDPSRWLQWSVQD